MKLFSVINSSISRKFTALMLATTFAALMVNAVALLLYDLKSYRENVIADLRTQADILARASAAAIAFGDRKDTTAQLATLAARSDVEAAAVYDSEGRIFALFARRPELRATIPQRAQPAGVSVGSRRAVVSRDIFEKGQLLGNVYVEARSGLRDRLLDYMSILAGVMLLALVAGLVMAAALQRLVTKPILSVAETARKVVEQQDFSARAEVNTQDETRVLAEAFNEMLGEVELQGQALRAADRRKDEFLATLAHELRNPLAPIRTALSIMEMKPTDERFVAEARAMIERQTRQMVRLIDDLMDVSRIATGKLVLHREPAALRGIAEHALEAAQPLIASRDVKLDFRLPAPDTQVYADPIRLAQVLLNLLNNAVKFSEAGGRILFEVTLDNHDLLARVCDSGKGIAPEMLSSIFEMFVQADRSLERSTAGLGVGLSLSRRIVELHGGTIEAKSAGIGKGSEFIVRIPGIRSHAAAGERREKTLRRTAGECRRILLADDNRDFAESFAILLRGMGNEVQVTYDGSAALAAAAEFRPDVAFLDIGLPSLNGFDLARRLRASPATSASMLVAISGWGQPSDKARAKESGFDRYLVKPVDPMQIEALLQERP